MGDTPMEMRWQSMQGIASLLISNKTVILDGTVVRFLAMAGITDLTILPMLCLAFKAIMVAHVCDHSPPLLIFLLQALSSTMCYISSLSSLQAPPPLVHVAEQGQGYVW